MIPFRTGNLGVERLAAARAGRPLPDPEEECRLLPGFRAAGFDAVEDYVFRELVEPARGRFDWSVQRAHAAAARAAGLSYWVYPWAHAVPTWFRHSDGFVPGRCLEHGAPGPMMSPFATATRDAVLGFLRAVRAGLGDVLDGIAVAFPADYGEAGFLSGVAGWLLGEGTHHHTGLWCDEREARLAFARQVRDAHGTPARLGKAWGMDGGLAWEHCPYPHGPRATPGGVPSSPTVAHRLDFARCYQGAVTGLVRALLEEARTLFPRLPRELKLGHCSETLELGTDWHALVGVAAETGTTLRFTGAGMGEVFTRRLASLCRGHGVPFATEAPREVDERHLVERLYTDLAAGTTGFFEYPEQMEAVRAPLQALRPALGRAPVRPAVALAYPTTELRLAPGHGAPTDTVHCFDALRRACDLAPLDERQIARGALDGHAALVWLEDGRVPRETLAAVDAWVRAGGVLLHGGARAPVPLDATDDDAPLAALLDALRPTELRYRTTSSVGAVDAVRVVDADGAVAPVVAVHPGEAAARPLLGGDWHGRDDGAWAWPADARAAGRDEGPAGRDVVPCRWTGANVSVHVPRPAGTAGRGDAGDTALDLLLDAWAPEHGESGPVRLALDGAPPETLALRGLVHLRRPLPAAGADADAVVRVTLELPARRPPGDGEAADRRELGLLVRRIALVPRDAPRLTAQASAEATDVHDAMAPLRADGPRRALGAGCVLPGDGTPLSALARLRAWLDGVPPSAATARDLDGRCLVTALDGGLLVRNPSTREAKPRVADAAQSAESEPLAPLSSRWKPR